MASEFGHLFDLRGCSALVTGGCGALGSATIHRLAEHGAEYVCVERTRQLAEPIIDQVKQSGRRGLAIGGDVRNACDVDAAVQQTLDAFGRIDLLVHAAGFGANDPAETAAFWRSTADTSRQLRTAAIRARTVGPTRS